MLEAGLWAPTGCFLRKEAWERFGSVQMQRFFNAADKEHSLRLLSECTVSSQIDIQMHLV